MTPSHRDANVAIAADFAERCANPIDPVAVDRFDPPPRVRAMLEAIAAAFPDGRFETETITADDERVVLHGTFYGTHHGTWRGVPPTGRSVSAASVLCLVIGGGAILDLRVLSDSLSMAEQLGAVAPLGPKACELFDRAARS